MDQKELLKEFRYCVRTVAFISEIPEKKRTNAHSKELEACQEFVLDNFTQAVEVIYENLLAGINLDLDGMDGTNGKWMWLREILDSPKHKSPKFPEVFTPEAITDLIVDLNSAQVVIASALEEIEPVYDRWCDNERRMQMVYKSSCDLSTEWKAKGLFELDFPEDIYQAKAMLGQYVSAFKHRLSQLERTYDALSRIITVMGMNPTEAMVRKTDHDEIYGTSSKGKRFGGKSFRKGRDV